MIFANCEYHSLSANAHVYHVQAVKRSISLKPQDVLVLLKLLLVSRSTSSWSFAFLANELSMSASEVHAAIGRAEKCGLYDPVTRAVRRENFTEFLVHGLRYVFPAEFVRKT